VYEKVCKIQVCFLAFLTPRSTSYRGPARPFFNIATKAGEALVNAGHVSGKYSKILGVLACERALWK
jgi:hypothetical protein